MSRLAHQVLDDGRVLISAVGQASSFHLTAEDAKRLAWGLLADLAPEDAEVRSTRRRKVKPAAAGERCRVVLGHLLLHPRSTSEQVAAALGISRGAVAMCLNRQAKCGCVVQASKTRANPRTGSAPATWVITAAGREELLAMTHKKKGRRKQADREILEMAA